MTFWDESMYKQLSYHHSLSSTTKRRISITHFDSTRFPRIVVYIQKEIASSSRRDNISTKMNNDKVSEDDVKILAKKSHSTVKLNNTRETQNKEAPFKKTKRLLSKKRSKFCQALPRLLPMTIVLILRIGSLIRRPQRQPPSRLLRILKTILLHRWMTRLRDLESRPQILLCRTLHRIV